MESGARRMTTQPSGTPNCSCPPRWEDHCVLLSCNRRAPISPADAPPASPGTQTPAMRLRAALRALCWTSATLAPLTRRSVATTRRWAVGEADVPVEVLAWVERLKEAHENNPPPPK